MEEEYESEELLSGANTNDDDGEARPGYPRFHKEDMCNGFKWKLGMEFGSLREFKDAMLEHSILNGNEVSAGIDEWKAWKARQFAMNIVDGDVSQ
ncbi:hypothetical protein SESBI_21934 [Sesbania bispinosa]|nr:hypothetical protein SESBI_21934 [Sesbania bispinosa]